MNVDVIRNGTRWEVWERTHMGSRLLVGYPRRKQALLVARFYSNVTTKVTHIPISLTLRDRSGSIIKSEQYR